MSLITTLYLMERYGPRLDLSQAAEVLGTTTMGLHKRVGQGTLGMPSYLDGKTRYIDVRDLADYLDRCRADAISAARGGAVLA